MDKMCLLKVSQAAEVSLLYLILLVENLSVYNLSVSLSLGVKSLVGKSGWGFNDDSRCHTFAGMLEIATRIVF